MNQDAEQFRGILLEADFQVGLDVVHAGQAQGVRQGAVAGKIEAAVDALEGEIMDIQDLWKLRRNHSQAMFKFSVGDDLFGHFNGGGLALNVSQDIGDLGDLVTDAGFQLRDLVVGLFEGHAFIEFYVLLDMEAPAKLLDTDIVHIEIAVSGDAANAVEDIFGMLRTREGLNGYIRIGKDAVNRVGHGSG
jgi:hypothetical protein